MWEVEVSLDSVEVVVAGAWVDGASVVSLGC